MRISRIFLALLMFGCGQQGARVRLDESEASASKSVEQGLGKGCNYTGSNPRGVVKVTDFGAVGDGQTDDTAAFKCAIGWFAPGGGGQSNGGGTVLIPAGFYNVADTLELPRGLRVQGNGTAAEGFCQVRLTQPNRPLFRISNGPSMTKVAVRDVELRYLGTPTAPNYPINAAVVEASNTVGIAITGKKTAGWIQELMFENVRFAGFTRGMDVDSLLTDRAEDPMVDGVQMNMVFFESNTVGLHLRSANMSNWNVQNLNTFQLAGQTGIVIDAGGAEFFQVNCAAFRSTPSDPRSAPVAGACIEVHEHSGVRLRALHAEGTRHALKITDIARWFPRTIVIENSFLGEGVLVEGASRIVSVGNLYPGRSLALPSDPVGVRRAEFVGSGTASVITSVGDAFENPLTGAYGGEFIGIVPEAQVDEGGVHTKRVSARDEYGAGPLIEAIAATNASRDLLRLGQEQNHYTFRRDSNTGYLNLTGSQTNFWNADWTGLNINGVMQLKRYGTQPNTCAPNFDGAMAMTQRYTTCVCRAGTGWVSTSDGTTACTWN